MCDSVQNLLGTRRKINAGVVWLFSDQGGRMSVGKYFLLIIVLEFGALCGASPALSDPILGSADPYAVLGATLVSASGDGANIVGSVGAATSAVTGPMAITDGTLSSAGAGAALSAANAAAIFLSGLAGAEDLSGSDLGGRVLNAGIYKFTTAAALNGTLTLDAQGNDNAVFIFDIGTELITGSNAKVALINGGPNDGVFWIVGKQATLGDNTVFQGNIIAGTGIVLDPSAQIQCGRAIANTAVTMAGKTAANPTNLVSINGIPAGCAGGFGGGYDLTGIDIARVNSGGFVAIPPRRGGSSSHRPRKRPRLVQRSRTGNAGSTGNRLRGNRTR